MNKTILPGQRGGCVTAPASKSQAHRLLICAALGQGRTRLLCREISKDIAATVSCLTALGVTIRREESGEFIVDPIKEIPQETVHLQCGESGSTLRFLLPLAGALGVKAVFHMEGRLPERPLSPLDEELQRHGMTIWKEEDRLCCEGQLQPGEYQLPGNVSSQYISGLLMALPLLAADSRLHIIGELESAPYVAMTEAALRQGGLVLEQTNTGYRIPGAQRPRLPEVCSVEGDWSNGAFFLCAGALSDTGICVKGLDLTSNQGDRRILELLQTFGADVTPVEDGVFVQRKVLKGCCIDASEIPDLIPVVSIVAAVAEGETQIVRAGRLRLKESDRLRSTAALLTALGGEVTELEDGLIISGRPVLPGGRADSWNDHRIAMAAAVAACVSRESVIIENSQCTDKSYPRFWEDFAALKGAEL